MGNNRLLIYSKHKIFFGSLLKVSNVADLDLMLQESDFKINVMETRAQKKLRKNGLRHLKLKEQDLDFVLGDNDDFIEEIFSIRKAKKGKRNNVVIMIRSNNQKLVFIEYDLEGRDDQDADSETVEGIGLSMREASKNSKAFFNSQGNVMIADPDVGIIDLKTGEVLFEYHINEFDLSEEKGYQMSWGCKLY